VSFTEDFFRDLVKESSCPRLQALRCPGDAVVVTEAGRNGFQRGAKSVTRDNQQHVPEAVQCTGEFPLDTEPVRERDTREVASVAAFLVQYLQVLRVATPQTDLMGVR
jgi:hypothetical protein